MKLELLEKQFTIKCRHFTCIHDEQCKKGINYRKIVGGPDLGWARNIPCFALPIWPDSQPVTCNFREFPTLKEAEQYRKDVDLAFANMADDLKNGRCPQCHKAVRQRQVGACVYGTCGHRLYQGKVNLVFKE